MVPVEIAGLEARYANLNAADGERPPLCRAPGFKKPRGRPQTARCTADERRARLANLVGIVQVPDRVQRCSRCRAKGHNVRTSGGVQSVWGGAAAVQILGFEGGNCHYAAYYFASCANAQQRRAAQSRTTFFFPQCGGGYYVGRLRVLAGIV